MLSKEIRRSWRAVARTLAAAVFLIGGAGTTNEIYGQEASGETIARRNTDEGAKSSTPGPRRADGKVDPEELARIVAALEDRIRDLESKLAAKESKETAAPAINTAANAVSPATAAPAVGQEVAELKKELSAMQEDAKKNSGFINFFRDVEVSGLVDGYYSYNFNRPDGRTNTGRAFDRAITVSASISPS